MGKLKTKKGVAKRYKLTKKGRLKYHSGGKSHLATSKKTKRKRSLRKASYLHERKEKAFIRSMLPYG